MKSKRDSQYYTKIAKQYCIDNGEFAVTRGNLQMLEDLYELFKYGRINVPLSEKPYSHPLNRHKYVLDKLDMEWHRPDRMTEKYYYNYPGIVNRPCRNFFFLDLEEEFSKSKR